MVPAAPNATLGHSQKRVPDDEEQATSSASPASSAAKQAAAVDARAVGAAPARVNKAASAAAARDALEVERAVRVAAPVRGLDGARDGPSNAGPPVARATASRTARARPSARQTGAAPRRRRAAPTRRTNPRRSRPGVAFRSGPGTVASHAICARWGRRRRHGRDARVLREVQPPDRFHSPRRVGAGHARVAAPPRPRRVDDRGGVGAGAFRASAARARAASVRLWAVASVGQATQTPISTSWILPAAVRASAGQRYTRAPRPTRRAI